MARVQSLEREYREARLERDNGEEIQRTLAQEVVQMDERLAGPPPPAEEREQLRRHALRPLPAISRTERRLLKK